MTKTRAFFCSVMIGLVLTVLSTLTIKYFFPDLKEGSLMLRIMVISGITGMLIGYFLKKLTIILKPRLEDLIFERVEKIRL